MEFSQQVLQVAQKKIMTLAIDRLLDDSPPLLSEMIKNTPEVKYTFWERIQNRIHFYKTRWYLTTLWEAIRGKHICDTNDY